MNERSLTLVIPAYNEERGLRFVVERATRLSKKLLDSYEVIIIDDASSDTTGTIADELAKNYEHVSVVHNSRNMNLGFNFQEGVRRATKQYVSLVPGDDDVSEASLESILRAVGKADIVLAYHANYEVRHPLRRVVSRMFVRLMNFLFGLKVRYYNGPAVFNAEALRGVTMTTFGFAYMAEIVVTLLKRGYSYIEVPMYLKADQKGANLRVFRWRNTSSVIKTIATLFWRARILRRI